LINKLIKYEKQKTKDTNRNGEEKQMEVKKRREESCPSPGERGE
jgi:hypothetical protein